MQRALSSLLLLALSIPLHTVHVSPPAGPQTNPPEISLASQLTTMLHRNAGGHSPTEEEIRAVETESGVSDPKLAREAAPFLLASLSSADSAMRGYGLAALIGMQIAPDSESATEPERASQRSHVVDGNANNHSQRAQTAPSTAAFEATVADVLAPLVPAIAARLIDDNPDNRSLAATVLGGFAATPPATIFPPLYGYLRRDDAIGQTGLTVVSDLLQLGHVSPQTASAVGKYLRRPDQTLAARTDLLEMIAAKPEQSQAVNQALVSYLDSDDEGLRSRVILSLPQLDLSPEVFAHFKARVAELAASNQDSLQVSNAAKAVTTCWTAVRITQGCPAN